MSGNDTAPGSRAGPAHRARYERRTGWLLFLATSLLVGLTLLSCAAPAAPAPAAPAPKAPVALVTKIAEKPLATVAPKAPAAEPAKAAPPAGQELTFTTFAEDTFEEQALQQMAAAFAKKNLIKVRLTIIRPDGSRIEFSY